MKPRLQLRKSLGDCPKCGAKLVKYYARGGVFVACEYYPKCKGRPAAVILTATRKGGK